MAFSSNFDRRLRETLEHKKKGVPGLKWVNQWRADERSRLDLVGLKGNSPAVVVEVELKRDNPAENVIKIWRWRAKNKNRSRILFLHAFSAHYVDLSGRNASASKEKQYQRAVFVGNQMEKDRSLHIKYKWLPLYTITRTGNRIQFKPLMRRGVIVKEGGGAMRIAAENLAGKIKRELRAQGLC